MPTKTVSFLSNGALDRIDAESLKILENVGVRVENTKCRAVLERAGARTAGLTNVMRLPAPVVDETTAQITKRFELHAHAGPEWGRS